MAQLKFLETVDKTSKHEDKKIKAIRGFFFVSQNIVLFLLLIIMFFDFWNINSTKCSVWPPLTMNLVASAILIFGLVSFKNDVTESNHWYPAACFTFSFGFILYIFYITMVLSISGADAYLFPTFSPFRDDWPPENFWYESHYRVPSAFPFGFWIGATIEVSLGIPTGKVVVTITSLLFGLMILGGSMALTLPRVIPKRMSKLIFV